MFEAESILMQWAFESLGVVKIWGLVRDNNIASVITMKKLGFKIEGTLRQHYVVEGKRIDVFQAGLLKEDFRNCF